MTQPPQFFNIIHARNLFIPTKQKINTINLHALPSIDAKILEMELQLASLRKEMAKPASEIILILDAFEKKIESLQNLVLDE